MVAGSWYLIRRSEEAHIHSAEWRAGSFRSNVLVTRAVQTRHAVSQQSAPQAKALTGIGYCSGLVQEFAAKGVLWVTGRLGR